MGKEFLSRENYQKTFRLLAADENIHRHMGQLMQQAASLVADELHIGKLDLAIDVPPSFTTPKGYHDNMIYYHPEQAFDEEIVMEFSRETGENGVVVILCHPFKGYQWEEEEKEEVTFFLETLYALSSRTRILGLIAKAAIIDNMTGAYNMAGYQQFCMRLFAQQKLAGYIAIFMNLRNFKYVNQSVGNQKGNEILRKYHFIVEGFLDEDEIFARPGGDNFVVLVKEEKITAFLDFISDITVSVMVGEEEKKFEIGARMGIYDIQPGENINYALDCASAALTVSRKSKKRSYVWFEPEMLANSLREKEILNTFPVAMKNKEFVVYYQPKVKLMEKELYGAEALVRWNRDGQILLPADFVPILEKDGSVCDLDFYMFACVCEDISNWIAEGIEPVRVSVNFSRLHLRNPNFVDGLITIMQLYEIEGKYLEIELTETTGYEDFEALQQVVEQLKMFDIVTSIDDFGSGYSSLGLLKDLDVDTIKLDKTFIDNLGNEDKSDEIIIKNVVNMIMDLEKEAIAEGVETEEQAAFLKDVGCPVVQGFLFDRPLEKEVFKERLEQAKTYYK